jgi:hypothetical protein
MTDEQREALVAHWREGARSQHNLERTQPGIQRSRSSEIIPLQKFKDAPARHRGFNAYGTLSIDSACF